MTSAELENLVRVGKLKKEPCTRAELAGLLHSGEIRLRDAALSGLSLDSRFDLAYNAAHALALAALRVHGYRSDNRYVVFQALPITAGIPAAHWRVLATCHDRRNKAEYEGILQADERLLADLRAVTTEVLEAVKRMAASFVDP